jgi:hypothetical protein
MTVQINSEKENNRKTPSKDIRRNKKMASKERFRETKGKV